MDFLHIFRKTEKTEKTEDIDTKKEISEVTSSSDTDTKQMDKDALIQSIEATIEKRSEISSSTQQLSVAEPVKTVEESKNVVQENKIENNKYNLKSHK